MATLVVIHKVENYDRWRAAYDAKSRIADGFGRQSEAVYRNADDPDDVAVIGTYDTADGIRSLMDSPELKAAMGEAGVAGAVQVHISE